MSRLSFILICWLQVGLTAGAAAAQGTGLAETQSCPRGTIAYWPFDGDVNEAVNVLPGQIIGNVSFAAGQVGQAASFDGDLSYVDAGLHPEISVVLGDEISFTAWIFPTEQPNPLPPGRDGDSAVITARTFCDDGNYQFYDRLSSTLYISKWDDTQDESNFHSSVQLNLNTWSHVAVSYSGGIASFYLNGVFQQDISDDFQVGFQQVPKRVQLGWDSCGSYFSGLLDEVAVYGVSLSDAEVAALYSLGVRGELLCSMDQDDSDSDSDSDSES